MRLNPLSRQHFKPREILLPALQCFHSYVFLFFSLSSPSSNSFLKQTRFKTKLDRYLDSSAQLRYVLFAFRANWNSSYCTYEMFCRGCWWLSIALDSDRSYLFPNHFHCTQFFHTVWYCFFLPALAGGWIRGKLHLCYSISLTVYYIVWNPQTGMQGPTGLLKFAINLCSFVFLLFLSPPHHYNLASHREPQGTPCCFNALIN